MDALRGRRAGIDVDRSKVLVLSTEGDTRREALACGEVLSAVLLDATLAGMATCPLTHMTELAAGRTEADDAGGGVAGGAFPEVPPS